MGFGEAVSTCLKKYANGAGRGRRSEYWWFALFGVLVGIVAGVIDAILGSEAVGLIASLALLIPSVAAGIRRLHDRGRSGWWLLIAFVPIVGVIVLLVWFVSDGDAGPNKYGEDPKGRPAFA